MRPSVHIYDYGILLCRIEVQGFVEAVVVEELAVGRRRSAKLNLATGIVREGIRSLIQEFGGLAVGSADRHLSWNVEGTPVVYETATVVREAYPVPSLLEGKALWFSEPRLLHRTVLAQVYTE